MFAMQRGCGENVLLLLLLNAICSKCWQANESTRNMLDWLHTNNKSSSSSEKHDKSIFGTTEIASTDTTSTNCLKMQCKFICFNGHSDDIEADIKKAADQSTSTCATIDELRLYNYHFENNVIPVGFLKSYGNKVKNLYIACSNVTDVEGGAFGNGIFRQLYLEELRLRDLRKDFFDSISWHFESLTIIQKELSIETLHADFLDHVKFQISYITLQIGLLCVRNVTASDNLLNALVYADFRYNNFADRFTYTTFGQLSMVEHLDLSNSQITYLPEYIFSDMASRLDYLDLSYNQLTTISASIFGWQAISSNLKLMLHNNNWHCTCELQMNLKSLYDYITIKTILCVTPMRYHNWSVFDVRLCYMEPMSSTTAKSTEIQEFPATLFSTLVTTCASCASSVTIYPVVTSTATPSKDPYKPTITSSTVPQGIVPTSPTHEEGVIEMFCLPKAQGNDDNSLQVKKATVDFEVVPDVEEAYVLVNSNHLNDSYGLLWFSKVTKQYYQMLINYNDYGLGCYGSISYRTTIENLEPGECYTVCIVLKQQMTISPFNCKSIRTHTNLQTNEWFTEDAVEKGIALLVFGIIGFTFLGIMGIYLVLKNKPILLKGSKRVATSRVNPDGIVVFPKEKTMASIKRKQEILEERCSRGTITCMHRRGSDDSTISYQSYMNANLYEVIPSYLKFEDDNSYADLHNALSMPGTYELPPPIPPPLPLSKPPIYHKDVVSYAEIPTRTKRTSDDPLPEVPRDQEPLSIDLSENVILKLTKTDNNNTSINMDSAV